MGTITGILDAAIKAEGDGVPVDWRSLAITAVRVHQAQMNDAIAKINKMEADKHENTEAGV